MHIRPSSHFLPHVPSLLLEPLQLLSSHLESSSPEHSQDCPFRLLDCPGAGRRRRGRSQGPASSCAQPRHWLVAARSRKRPSSQPADGVGHGASPRSVVPRRITGSACSRLIATSLRDHKPEVNWTTDDGPPFLSSPWLVTRASWAVYGEQWRVLAALIRGRRKCGKTGSKRASGSRGLDDRLRAEPGLGNGRMEFGGDAPQNGTRPAARHLGGVGWGWGLLLRCTDGRAARLCKSTFISSSHSCPCVRPLGRGWTIPSHPVMAGPLQVAGRSAALLSFLQWPFLAFANQDERVSYPTGLVRPPHPPGVNPPIPIFCFPDHVPGAWVREAVLGLFHSNACLVCSASCPLGSAPVPGLRSDLP